jgi:hypothetical protein
VVQSRCALPVCPRASSNARGARFPSRNNRRGEVMTYVQLRTFSAMALGLALGMALLSACSATPASEGSLGRTEQAICSTLTPTQRQILKFEDATLWTGDLASLANDPVNKTEGTQSVLITQNSGYTTITSAPLTTIPLTGRNITLDVRPPNPPANPTWFGNVTGYLEAPSKGLSSFSVYLGYQQIAVASPGTFQTLHFEIPNYAFNALTLNGGYSDLRIRFALSLPEGASYDFDNTTFDICL